MEVFINKTSRAIVIGGSMLIPGKKCQLDNVKKLKELYPRFTELLDSGDIVAVSKKDLAKDEAVKAEAEKAEQSDGEEPKTVTRRKRV